MLLLLIVIAVLVMIITYIFQYMSYRKSVTADKFCKLMNLDRYLDEAFENEYDNSDKPYSRESFFREKIGLSETYQRKLSNALHEHHSRLDLSYKTKQLKRNPDMDIDAILPGFMTEVRRVAHNLSLEIDSKLRKRATDDNQDSSKKRRRRR